MKFALRLTILGAVFTVMLAVIGLRLWFVQVAEGPQTAQAAEALAWLEKTSYGPRGDIRDRNGTLLATSRLVPAIVIDRTFVQPEDRDSLIQTLASIIGFDAVALGTLYDDAGINGRFQVDTVSNDIAYMINENLDHLPGVEIAMVPERVYLSGDTLAHVIGHLGLPDATDLEARPDLDLNLRIGKLGVERVYDEYLQGEAGLVQYQVQRGRIVDQRPPVEPEPGNSVVLNIDFELQELVELALGEGVALSNSVKEQARDAGDDVFSETQRAAAVVLDAKTFDVMALASFPDFDPQLFVAGIDADTFEGLTDTNAFNNLAISGLYPPSSTFKAITYTVKMEEDLPLDPDLEGVDVANQTVHCDGELILSELEDGSQPPKTDWYYPGNKGWLDIHGALEQSCNIYFWSVAMGTWRAYKDTPRENVLQDWAKSVGYGSATGVDLTAEAEGTVPTRELFEEWAVYQLENPDQPPLLEPNRLELASPWLGGDLVDMAIGQGAFTATPLQVAVSYAALVNGGRIMEPRVVNRIVDAEGDVVFEPESPVVGTVDIDPETRSQLLTDLNRVVTRGTAATAFAQFGPGLENVGGKTGTGQTSKNRDNHAWFVGVAPIDDPQYIVVILIDEGGSGGRVAAPVGRHIMQYLMDNEPTPIVEGAQAD
jgi:penicillin-binding protein 2